MSDDIVTRLREMWGDDDRCIWCKKHMDSQSSPHREVCDLMEAADEIEHLRAELQVMTQYRDHYSRIATGYYCDPTESEIYDEMYRAGCGEPSE